MCLNSELVFYIIINSTNSNINNINSNINSDFNSNFNC